MNIELICIHCGSALIKKSDAYTCSSCSKSYPIKDSIPRFVSEDNYANNFGFQWNKHRHTQLDSYTGVPISRDRLLVESGWNFSDLSGKRVLECGSGAGRFTEVLVDTNAQLASIDYSSAVEANYKSNGKKENLFLAQASIYELPFPKDYFDFLLCLGVIQHTPDVKKTVFSMLDHLKKGGHFCIDVYAYPVTYLHPRHLLRPITKHMNQNRLYQLIHFIVPLLFPIADFLHGIPFIGQYLARLIPIAHWKANISLPSKKLYLEWSVLDTFDWYSPAFESPQSKASLTKWMSEYGVHSFNIKRIRGLYVLTGIK